VPSRKSGRRKRDMVVMSRKKMTAEALRNASATFKNGERVGRDAGGSTKHLQRGEIVFWVFACGGGEGRLWCW